MDLLIAAVIAILLVALMFGIGALISRFEERRVLREMAAAACPHCANPVGLQVIVQGYDCSPWEEIWGGDGDGWVHCHPKCRRVECGRCGQGFVVRLNCEGPRCGPRLSSETVT